MLLRFWGRSSRQNDHWLIELDPTYVFQNCDPIELRHVQIQYHDIGAFAAKELQAIPPTIGEYYVIVLLAEKNLKESPDDGLISITRIFAMAPLPEYDGFSTPLTGSASPC